MRLHQIEHARNGCQHRDPPRPDAFDDVGRYQTSLEVYLGSEQRRNPQAHELTEDMAERKRVEDPDGVKESLVTEIFVHLHFDWSKTREYVLMSMNDTLGLARRSGSEH